MSGEVKYSRGRVWAPSIGISVGLMKVVTVGRSEWVWPEYVGPGRRAEARMIPITVRR